MIKPASILLLVGLLTRCSYADSWAAPKTVRIRSTCDRYTALVIPGDPTQADKPSKVHVYGGDPTETGRWQTEWAVTLSNPTAPVTVMLGDGGRHLVNFDDWGSVGYGDNAVAIYAHDGKVGKQLRHYSIEQLLSKDELQNVRRTVSSKWWRDHSHCFFDENADGRHILCLWLHLGSRWIAWDLSSGELVDIKSEKELVKRWNARNRVWALLQMKEHDGDTVGAKSFLMYLNDSRDSEILAALRAATQPASSANTLLQKE